jgi:monovalent cation/hydrogen antiporter
MQLLQTVILLLVVVLVATVLARRLVIPYPILLVLVGLGIGAVPGLPAVRLEPDLVFLVFLPPILFAAAFFTSFRDFRFNLPPILILAVPLVLATTAAVAAVAHALVPGLGWAAAIALGAILSPPDAVAATAVLGRLGVPRRVVTVLEGESLVNDAAALVLYRAAVAAAVTGSFVLGETLLQFVLATAIGIGVGIGVAYLTRLALQATHDSYVEIAITLLTPYVAWVLAERAHASGVLACVTAGLLVRRQISAIVSPAMRVQARAVWDLVIFLLNGVIFILIGLQLATLRADLEPGGRQQIWIVATAIFATLVVVRAVWVPVFTWLPRKLSLSLRVRDPMPPRAAVALISWVAMRGIVSLAAVLALPLATTSGEPFPFRSELVLITFAVVVASLLVQGLSLGPLVRWLPLRADDVHDREELQARTHTAVVALRRLEELEGAPWAEAVCIEALRAEYQERIERITSARFRSSHAAPTEEEESTRRLRHEVLTAERLAAIQLRDQGVINDDVLLHLETELDLEAIRAGIGDRRAR